ncbi:MAG: hypothetical protein MJ090_04060 [Clostridia bacterium]|nr:hypothetical protein [Clostridia bacterium]
MSEKHFDNHTAVISNRSSVDMSGIKSVISFDDESILLDGFESKITIKGENLSISSFNDELGDFKATGIIHGVIYLSGSKSDGGFFSRLLK